MAPIRAGRRRLDLGGDGARTPPPRTPARSLPLAHIGLVEALARRPSTTWRVLSEIHSSFTSSLMRGRMRITSRPRVSTRIAEPSASMTSNDLGLAELPGPGVEGIGLGGQRADRAEVDDVALQLRGHRLLEIGRDLHVLAAADRAELRHAGDLGREAHAAGALDAAVHRRLDQRPDVLVFDRALVLGVARGVDAVGHGLVLQVALAALVADRAIERMVDEQELHHPLARLLHHRRARHDLGRLALGPGRQSRTAQAQLATGLGEPATSTRHMRQLPAIDSRSW